MASDRQFTEEARHVLSSAHEYAARNSSDEIKAEHLLLGLRKEESGVAARVLHELGLDFKQLDQLTGKGKYRSLTIEISQEVKSILENSVDEAQRLRNNYIDTEHILLALLPFENRALDILRQVGITPDRARQKTGQILYALGRVETADAVYRSID